MGRRARRRTLIAAALLALVSAGCSGGDDAAESAADVAATQEAEAVDDADAGSAAAPGEPDATAAQDQAAEPGGEASAVQDTPDAAAGRQLIFRASVTLASNDPDATAADVRARAAAAGGFVSDTQLSRGEDGLLRGAITIRVPAEQLDALLEQVSETAAEVTAQQRSVEDVTGRVADIESRLRNLRALEEELLVLLTETREGGDTEQVLDVFDRISEVRGEIETLEGRRQELGELVALSTLTVQIEPTRALAVSVQSEPDEDRPLPWSPGNILANAWNATVSAVQGFVNAAIWVGVFGLPVLVTWLTPVALVWLAVRWWRRRSDAPGVRRPRSGPGGPDSSGSGGDGPSGPPPAPTVGAEPETAGRSGGSDPEGDGDPVPAGAAAKPGADEPGERGR